MSSYTYIFLVLKIVLSAVLTRMHKLGPQFLFLSLIILEILNFPVIPLEIVREIVPLVMTYFKHCLRSYTVRHNTYILIIMIIFYSARSPILT